MKHVSDLYKSQGHNTNEAEVISELNNFEKTKLSFRMSSKEIDSAMKSLKSGKATAPDGITGEMLKVSSPVLLPILVKIFNHILLYGRYPTSWSEGIITALHKKGSLYDPDKYRGITVASPLGKMFGIILSKRPLDFCEKNKIIDDRQSSYKKKSRTTDNIFILWTVKSQKLYT